MKQGSTFFLKAVVILIGLLALALCAVTLPVVITGEAGGYIPLLLGMYVTTIPFYFALYQTFQILSYIDKNKAFSELSIHALRYIKYCAFIISGMYAAGLPYIHYVADKDDAPGVFALGLVIVGASFVIATAAAVLQRLFQNAVDIKSENDLTV